MNDDDDDPGPDWVIFWMFVCAWAFIIATAIWYTIVRL